MQGQGADARYQGVGGCWHGMAWLQAGVTSGTLASAAVGATNVLGTMVAAGLMDRAGRKQLLTNSFLGQVRSCRGRGRSGSDLI